MNLNRQDTAHATMKDRRISILLIEDDEDDTIIFRHYLDELPDWSFDLEWATNADAALQKIKGRTYDICFIDYLLDRINGVETMLRLKDAGFSKPIVVLTGKGTHEIDILAMQQGADDFLEKSNLDAQAIERVIRHVLERSKVIEKLRSSEQRLQLLSAKLIDAQETERKLIARELHDSIGSNLTAIKFALESKLAQMKSGRKPAEGMSLEKIISIVYHTIEETQRITNHLRPLMLDDIGIIRTISWICRTFQAVYGTTRIEHDIRVEEEDVPEALKIVICRILQESLNNVRKHSQASTVRVYLGKTQESLELRIEDNGQGFDLNKAGNPNGSMGIDSMRDRAELSNGTFTLSSRRGRGTRIHIVWPI